MNSPRSVPPEASVTSSGLVPGRAHWGGALVTVPAFQAQTLLGARHRQGDQVELRVLARTTSKQAWPIHRQALKGSGSSYSWATPNSRGPYEHSHG